ncbi:MAG: hypothetical protein K6G85_05285 [Eubacterium sp.]|nr:hypothetical protein [Eubacterium sp.]
MLTKICGIIVICALVCVTYALIQIFRTVLFTKELTEQEKYKKSKRLLIVMSIGWVVIVIGGMMMVFS